MAYGRRCSVNCLIWEDFHDGPCYYDDVPDGVVTSDGIWVPDDAGIEPEYICNGAENWAARDGF